MNRLTTSLIKLPATERKTDYEGLSKDVPVWNSRITVLPLYKCRIMSWVRSLITRRAFHAFRRKEGRLLSNPD